MPGGRPRGVDDAVILRAAVGVIGQVGPSGLTLAAVGRAAGVVPGTLVQRFGSKHGLVLALAEQSAADARATHARFRDAPGSPVTALCALAVASMAPMSTPESFANHLAFLCLDLIDPQLRPHALTIHEEQGSTIRALLEAAVSSGELRAETDVAALARSVQALIAGTGLTWALERDGALENRLRQEIEALLAPRLDTSHDPAREDS